MARTITDLLDFALLGTSAPALPVPVGAVVTDVLADLAVGLTQAEVRVGELPAILGHESEVRAVLQNLIANAVKFAAPGGGAQVEVSGGVRETDAGPVARITVTDNGPGIPEEQRETVFGLAVRGDTTVAGYGIGLATCARIVRARGGRIGVEPAASGGAAFWFELPAAG
jgi:signal transduction histidine kinase